MTRDAAVLTAQAAAVQCVASIIVICSVLLSYCNLHSFPSSDARLNTYKLSLPIRSHCTNAVPFNVKFS